MSRLGPQLIVVLTAVLTANAQAPAAPDNGKQVHETFPERVPGDRYQSLAEMPIPLSLDWADAFQPGLNVENLGAVSAERLAVAEAHAAEKFAGYSDPPTRVSLVREIPAMPLSIASGAALDFDLDDTDSKVWTMAIQSPGAKALRVHFTAFDARGGEVSIYANTPDGPIVRGPYTGKGPDGDGDFWTASLLGDEVIIEAVGREPPAFKIENVLHFDQDPRGSSTEDNDGPPLLNCHLDVRCHDNDADARDAVGQINYMSGGSGFVCSGTLVNDQDTETLVPYFLTARHCIRTSEEVNSMEVVWFWQTNSCNGTLPTYNLLPRHTNATLVDTNSENDMSYLRLPGSPPAGGLLAGWTTATSVDPGIGIHHPAGSFKRIVFLDPVGFCPGCLCWDGSDYDYYNMENGLVQGGSSGSAVFNTSGQIAGQLRGRCSVCCDPKDMACNSIDDYWAVYGEFQTSFDDIANWLRIGGTVVVDRNAGSPQEGSFAFPYDTVNEGNNLVWNGARLKIRAGSYNETITFSKQMTVLAENGLVRIGQ